MTAEVILTFKRLGEEEKSIWPLPVAFPKTYLLKRGWNPGFLWLNFIISHIFSENFIEIAQVVEKIWSFSPSILTFFINFSDFLLQRNWWRQHIINNISIFYFQPTLNRLFNNYIDTDITLVLLEIWRGEKPSHQNKLLWKSAALLGLITITIMTTA